MSEHRGMPPDVEAKLHQLERLLTDAKAVPLSASIMLNRAEVEGLVADLRDAMPDELTQARWVIKERDDILDHARSDADQLLREARAERDHLVSEQEVVRKADGEADRIIGDAREQARQIRLEAEDYVDAKLANFEVVLNKTLGAVERGRAKLRGTLDADQLDTDQLAADELEMLDGSNDDVRT
jgi:cell division septum initiation protein DivIVA